MVNGLLAQRFQPYVALNVLANLRAICFSRRQPERIDEGYHRNAARRAGYPAGPGLHPRTDDTILHRARYACKRAYVRASSPACAAMKD